MLVLVSFIIVAYNAAQRMDSILEDIRGQSWDHRQMELILVDSASSDNTKECMKSFQQNHGHEFSRVLVLDNPGKILPCGWNVALREAKGDIIVRVDAHSHIPEDFVAANVNCMESGETVTGGPRTSIIDESSGWQRTLLIAESSMFGSGIAKYRNSTEKQYVNTLAHAAYKREVFETVGGYDERLARTEDNEMHYRMKTAGNRFCFDPSICSWHHARNTLPKMIRQKYLNGKWIGLTTGVCPQCFSLYHFVPFCFVAAILVTTVLSFFGFSIPAAALWITYWTAAILMAVLSVRGKPFAVTHLLLPSLFFVLHIAYGTGTLVGLLQMPFWRARPENRGCTAKEEVRLALLANHTNRSESENKK